VEDCYKTSENQETCFKTIDSNRAGSSKSWLEARDWCKSQTGGYSLAIVHDQATQDALARFMSDYEVTNRNVWIGARQEANSRWKWIDGTVEPGIHIIFSGFQLFIQRSEYR